VIIGLLPLPFHIQLIGIGVLSISLFIYLGRDGLLCFARSVVLLKLTNESNCMLETKGGQIIDCEILGSTFVSPYLTVLMLQASRSWFTQSVVIVPDMIDAEEFRRLRVVLRWRWKQSVTQDA